MVGNKHLHLDTWSWKYDSWRGLVYSAIIELDYLHE